MTPEHQLLLWRHGLSIHNRERNECCPDFSCCQPKLASSLACRRYFAEANLETQTSMLMGFLGAAVAFAAVQSDKDVEVYIAGDPANYLPEQ